MMITNRKLFSLAFGTTYCLTIAICHAGRMQNDRAVAALAVDYFRYDKEGQSALREAGLILDSLPRAKYRLDDSIPKDTPVGLRTACAFIEASTWPDRVANVNDLDHDEDRPTWHRIAIPLNLDGIHGPEPALKLPNNDKTPLDFALDKRSTFNLVQSLQLNELLLKDASTPPERRAIALCWFINLVAEVSQPTNTSSLYSKQFPNGDDCGSLYLIGDHGKVNDWHSLWDSSGDPDSSSLATLRKYMTPRGRRGPPYWDDSIDVPNYATWALSAHNFDRNVRRLGFPGGMSAATLKELNASSPPDLPEGLYLGIASHYRHFQDMGGYHLAMKLREIFGLAAK